MGNMRVDAEVDQGTAAVYSGGSTIGNVGLDNVFLVLVILLRGPFNLEKTENGTMYALRTSLVESPLGRQGVRTSASP